MNGWINSCFQFSSVQSLSRVWLLAIPWTAARQASLSITKSLSPPKSMSIVSVMPSNHLILCRPLLPSIFSSIRVFSNESALHIRWPKDRSFSFNIRPSDVTQLCPTLCNPIDYNMSGFPVHHQLPELAQTHVHWVSDANQPSHPLSSTSPAFILSQHQGLFQWVSSSHQVAKLLELHFQHQSFQWIFRTDFL